MRKIAVLTSGGDAPGMNAAIRAVVRAGIYSGFQVFGVMRGLQGLIQGDWQAMNLGSVADIIHRGGTVLKTSRSEEFMEIKGRVTAYRNLQRAGIDNLAIIGGNGSLTGGWEISKLGVNVIGIPATIDNDIAETTSIGFDTAVNTVADAINRIRDTASSHGRVFIIEVMGRHCGEIALSAGVAGGAESILIPEINNDLREVVNKIKQGAKRGKLYSIVLVAEGAGSTYEIKEILAEQTGMDVKVIILGHIQRGGTPSAADRILASAMGKAAVDNISEGKRNVMMAGDCHNIEGVSLEGALNKNRQVRNDLVALARVLST
ncbi:MAG: 6-phosphofructokinase [Syntrophomonadaceae bacterium]|nr:6-phosphofructokinase [Syntrophomonadaceae bacterium]